jgi:hypothetical protein
MGRRERRRERLRRYGELDRRSLTWISIPIVVTVLAVAPAARATDRGTATAVLNAQLALLDKQRALNKCLAASPHKNTPCIRKKSLSLAKLAAREIRLIHDAVDGTEKDCVRTVAQQEVAYLGIWRKGALALYRNERKKARRLFTQSLTIADAQQRVQPSCFSEVLAGP